MDGNKDFTGIPQKHRPEREHNPNSVFSPIVHSAVPSNTQKPRIFQEVLAQKKPRKKRGPNKTLDQIKEENKIKAETYKRREQERQKDEERILENLRKRIEKERAEKKQATEDLEKN